MITISTVYCLVICWINSEITGHFSLNGPIYSTIYSTACRKLVCVSYGIWILCSICKNLHLAKYSCLLTLHLARSSISNNHSVKKFAEKINSSRFQYTFFALCVSLIQIMQKSFTALDFHNFSTAKCDSFIPQWFQKLGSCIYIIYLELSVV